MSVLVCVIPIIALLIVTILLGYLVFKSNNPTRTQRLWPIPKPFTGRERMVFMADAILNLKKDPIFLIKKDLGKLSTFKTMIEKQTLKNKASAFFKKQFGISDNFLNLFMMELHVNDKMGYHAECIKSTEKSVSIPILDGGFIVFIPAGITLTGIYGGKNGVKSDRPGVLAYGYYTFGPYKIKYFGVCPLQSWSTYDNTYSYVDCDVIIEKSPKKSDIGLHGKAVGIMINSKLRGGMNSVVIRNVLTF